MANIVSALTARTQLGQIIKRTSEKNERFVVDRARGHHHERQRLHRHDRAAAGRTQSDAGESEAHGGG